MTLPQRPFAATGKNVSVLGLGTVKFGRNQGVKYPAGEGFALPTEREMESLLDSCLENGINLLDTAPAYGTAEERLGSVLGARREKFFLVSKTGEEFDNGASQYIFSAEHTRMSVERSLRRLSTDFIDCVFVHSSLNDLEVITQTPVLEVLARFKEQGKIGAFGVSSYTVEGGKKAAELCDAVMVAYNQSYTDELPVIQHAQALGKAVLIKKGLASGHVGQFSTLQENINFVLNTAGVTSLVFGSLNPANILANIRAVSP